MKKKNLYDLIPDGGKGCNEDLDFLVGVSSDINDLFAGIEINNLDELNAVASDILKEYPELRETE